MTDENKDKLWMWQERFRRAADVYRDATAGIERRNAIYGGTTAV